MNPKLAASNSIFRLSCILFLCIFTLNFCQNFNLNIHFEQEDGGPDGDIDLSGVKEAIPQEEEWARYGNQSPYYVLGKTYEVLDTNANFSQYGIASWYGTKFHGELTSTREAYDMYAMTAAHKTLPLPSYVRVTNLDNNRQIIVRVNDRGPFVDGRIIDLSYAAAHKLDMHEQGTARVFIETLPPFITRPDAGATSQSKTVVNEKDFPANKKNYLQIGVFTNPETAEALKLSLSLVIDIPVFIKKDKLDNKVIYKVRIGPLPSFEELLRTQTLLVENNFPDFYLISE